MRIPIYIILFSFLSFGCISDKTCSNEDKSCNIQALISSAFSVPEGIYVYSTNAKYQGNLSAYGSTPEISAQNICKEEKLFSSLANQFCPDVWALIATVSVALYDYNTSYSVSTILPVYGPTGIMLATNWDNFVVNGSTNLLQPLASAGLGTDDFWTFSSIGGGLGASDCSQGADNTNASYGVIGSATTTNVDWLNVNGTATVTCNTSHRVLCICFTPDTSSQGQ
ncbi:hypothetical protein [Leptospira saintgironsiae]|uniref:DUF1554 domain-containing protein n=1 Tax=Leptospira saintgironsiae TaxID=2023183 RepID=A0A2M9YA73_9LEPT|nr:hypothetical protein [Leptospira saintgironsiae]PJZ48464.1 hypothetical protein CH362_14780 [Leptospira saintgironsiae]